MGAVQGQVICTESGLGIRGLLVEAFDIPGTEVSDGIISNPKTRRLASGLTGSDGHFRLTFADPPGDPVSISLLVAVSGPETGDRAAPPLFISPRARPRAAAEESYLIQIPEKTLEDIGLKPPGVSDEGARPAQVAARRIVGAAEDALSIADAQQSAFKLKIQRASDVTARFDTDFADRIRARLSQVGDVQAASDTFVADDNVRAANASLIAADLSGIINEGGKRAPVKVRFALTEDQHDTIEGALENGRISRARLVQLIGASGVFEAVEYAATSPVATLRRELSDRERAAAEAIGISLPPAPPPSPSQPTVAGTTDVLGEGAAALRDGDIDTYLGRLTSTMTSPEEAVLVELEPKATRDDLSNRMQGLKFQPSPAEVSAFYDFNHLQIAFRHVWQEAIDEGILNLAESAYDQVVNAGGSPDPAAHRDPLRALTKAGQLVVRAARAAPPMVMAKPAMPTAPDAPGNGRDRGWWHDLVGGVMDGVFEQAPPSTGEPNADALPDIINELNQRLREPYAFTTFAANRQERSVNFGCLVTYRQSWDPVVYQAGRIAKTLTLAPREVQRYSKTVRRKTKRAEKEVKNHLQIRKDEMSTTSRLEQEIVAKAQTKTHFEMSAEQSAPGGGGPSAKMSFGREANQNSDQAKKSFRESVIKAAQEFKDEFNVEITTEEADEFETVETGELSNPNDELAVTFIFYELQRRYRISERLHRLTPIVFVAQEMPAPHEINESWIIAHDWILRRVLLDDSFVPALDYLCSRIVGDGVAIGEIRTNITQQRQILTELKQQLKIVRERTATYRGVLEKSMLVTAERRAESNGGGGGLLGGLTSVVGAIPGLGSAIELGDDAMEAVGNFLNPDTPNVGDNRLDMLKEAIQRSIEDERDVLMRVEREVTALNALTETYAKLRADNQNQRALVLRLRMHLKQNITYYMQAIWSHEPPDQRYLRLHEVPVPTFKDASRYDFGSFQPIGDAMNAHVHHGVGDANAAPTRIYEATVMSEYAMDGTEPLAKVAHLDEVKGYFGNYMMFALKESNALTEFMMEPYVLRGFDELTDPDDIGNWTLDEFAEYVVRLEAGLTAAQFEAVKDQLAAQYARLLKSPLRDGEEIVVPTGSLYIEALPAGTSLHEGLKRLQRTMDVKLAQEGVRAAALKNLLLADRLLNDERDDPEIDKKVVITGLAAGPTVPVDDPG